MKLPENLCPPCVYNGFLVLPTGDAIRVDHVTGVSLARGESYGELFTTHRVIVHSDRMTLPAVEFAVHDLPAAVACRDKILLMVLENLTANRNKI